MPVSRRKKTAIALAAALILTAAILYYWLSRRTQPLAYSGTVETREIEVGSKVGGRVTSVSVEEGQQVAANAPLVAFEHDNLSAQLAQQQAAVAQAQADLDRLQHGNRPAEIAQADAALHERAAELAEARNGPRPQELRQAQADFDAAKANAVDAASTYARMQPLVEKDVISRQQFDEYTAQRKATAAQAESARQHLALLQAGTRVEDLQAANQRYQQSLAADQLSHQGFRQSDIDAGKARLAAAEAQVQQIEANLREATLSAPDIATVETVSVRPGDLRAGNTAQPRARRPERSGHGRFTASHLHGTRAGGRLRSRVPAPQRADPRRPRASGLRREGPRRQPQRRAQIRHGRHGQLAMSDTAGNVIHAEHLTIRFGDFTAVDDVSFDIRKGELFGFLGPNGSGKTTIIRALCGLTPLASGNATILGMDVRKHAAEIKRHVGYMSQKFGLYEDLTVSENLDFYAAAYGLTPQAAKTRIQELLTLTGLEPYFTRRVAQLSGGWKQRLALACAIIHSPEVVFLDEPTAGIDPVARRSLWDLFFQLSGQGVTFFVTTHYMDEAERCGRLGYIYMSKLIALGTIDDLRKQPDANPPGTSRLDIEAPAASTLLPKLRQFEGVREATIFGRAIHALIETSSIDALKAAFPQLTVRIIDSSLEDIFVTLTYHIMAEQEAAKR
jgi:ABC-2 type transport system ATP-binding protein